MSARKQIFLAWLCLTCLIGWPVPLWSEPCCITLVPPPPPPPRNEARASSYGAMYSQLPLLAALERGLFGNLKVEVRPTPISIALGQVSKSVGLVGMAPITSVADFNARGGEWLQVVGVLMIRPDYALFVRPDGPSSVLELKGQAIAVPGYGSLAHLYVVSVLRSEGLSEKDVKLVVVEPGRWESVAFAAAIGSREFVATPFFDGMRLDPKVSLKKLAGPGAVRLPFWVLYVSSSTISREPEQLTKFVMGIDRGLKVLRAEPAIARSLLERADFGDEAAKAIVELVPVVLSDTVKPDLEEIERTARLMREVGSTKDVVRLTDEASLKKIYEARGR